MSDHSWQHRVSMVLTEAMQAAIKQWNSDAMKTVMESSTDPHKIRAGLMTLITTEYADRITSIVEEHFGSKSSS